MNTSKTPILNRDLTNEKISLEYPYVEVTNPSDALALVLLSLDEGDLPIICISNGTKRRLRCIRKSARLLMYLLSVSPLVYVKGPEERVDLKGVYDIMEVLK